MFNAKTFLRQCLLTIALASSAAVATAGPTTFHVNVDTSSLSGNGYLDFFMGAGVAAPLASATISNLSSGFLGVDPSSGDYTVGPGAGYTLVNGPGFNDLLEQVTLGGLLSFDVMFGGPFLTTPGNEDGVFSISLLDQSFQVFGNPNGVAIFDLVASPNGPATIGVSSDSDFAAVSQTAVVPEPSDLLLMVSGLAVMGWVARRKAGAAR
jgi:hypothetical protein